MSSPSLFLLQEVGSRLVDFPGNTFFQPVSDGASDHPVFELIMSFLKDLDYKELENQLRIDQNPQNLRILSPQMA